MNNLHFTKGIIKYNQNGGITEVLTGMIPIYGTYQDYKTFREKPTLENFGWMAASGLGDVLFFTGLGTGIKALKGLNTARKSAKVIRNARMATRQTNQVQMLEHGEKVKEHIRDGSSLAETYKMQIGKFKKLTDSSQKGLNKQDYLHY